ncbi:hypothetical protein B0H13DRAFT_1926276 [Mycena leptocephala]|nr:hypothetical protein B0H13DRAFT_1926276 [Mycena leptocephala]
MGASTNFDARRVAELRLEPGKPQRFESRQVLDVQRFQINLAERYRGRRPIHPISMQRLAQAEDMYDKTLLIFEESEEYFAVLKGEPGGRIKFNLGGLGHNVPRFPRQRGWVEMPAHRSKIMWVSKFGIQKKTGTKGKQWLLLKTLPLEVQWLISTLGTLHERRTSDVTNPPWIMEHLTEYPGIGLATIQKTAAKPTSQSNSNARMRYHVVLSCQLAPEPIRARLQSKSTAILTPAFTDRFAGILRCGYIIAQTFQFRVIPNPRIWMILDSPSFERKVKAGHLLISGSSRYDLISQHSEMPVSAMSAEVSSHARSIPRGDLSGSYIKVQWFLNSPISRTCHLRFVGLDRARGFCPNLNSSFNCETRVSHPKNPTERKMGVTLSTFRAGVLVRRGLRLFDTIKKIIGAASSLN